MRRFDIGTLPSRDDPFPLVVLEPMVLGVPVVAFGVGSVAEQLGDAGVVVLPGRVTAFADALVELVDDEEARRTLGSAGRRRAEERYSVSAFGEAVVLVVDEGWRR